MFDFDAYLRVHLPAEASFTVSVLTGGLTNATVRVSFTTPTTFNFFPEPLPSVVLKHAPPYIAADPTQPLSTHRQQIEAAALRFLSEQQTQTRSANVRFPRLVHLDDEANVLWITDLGACWTLSEYLSSSPSPSADLAVELGTRLGAFMSAFWAATARPEEATLTLFERESKGEDAEGPAGFISATARRIMTERGVDVVEAEMLSLRIAEAMRMQGAEAMRIQGAEEEPERHTLGLVDWEYFGLSTPGAEIGMLDAHLHILIASKSPAIVATGAFIAAFHAALISEHSQKQTLLTYGREMVTALEFFAMDLDEQGKTEVFEAGMRALRAATSGIGRRMRLCDPGW